MAAMQHFFLKLIAPRSSFAMDMSADEKAIMAEHLAYWKAKLDNGEVIVFGPVMDPKAPYGMGAVAAADETAARAFADGDPAIKSRRGFTCEIHPMRAVTRETVNAP
ncbi:MAG: YciI family protein [Xanthobacteraceae bacterium]